MNSRIYLLLIACFVMVLSACQPTGSISPTRPDNAAVIAAEQAEQSGDYASAATQYLDLAAASGKQQQAEFYFRAAQAFWQSENIEQAASSISNVDFEQLSIEKQYDAAILKAEILLIDGLAEEALAALDPYTLDGVSDNKKSIILKLKVQAYEITENWLEKANSNIQLDPLLADVEREQNQQEIWFALMNLSPQTLDLFNPGSPPAIDSGWFALAYAIKAYQENSEAMIVALEDWQRSYPNHPADPSLYQVDTSAGTQLPENITDIAILLPEYGPYKTAATAIKEGIVAAHLTAESDVRLHFYAVNTDREFGTSNVLQQYQRAIDQQVSLIIGPLDKIALQLLAESESLPIPVLALNRLSDHTSKTNLFQFGLAPEDDAVAVANYASNQGFDRTIVLSPENSWGDRISTAFIEQWQSNGGTVLNQAKYDMNQNDFSDILIPLLGLSSSSQRKQSLIRTISRKLEFEPRRRQDIDFVFLVAKPLKARQLVPQLKFYRSASMPIIATSHAYSGLPNSQQDIDLNKLIINDVPWVFSDMALSDPVYQALQSNQPENFDRLIRLYALGSDAYHLVAELNTLSNEPESHFNGATGQLSIDALGNVSRVTPWGVFKDGLLGVLLGVLPANP